MARPVSTLVQMPYRNPHASADLILPVLVVCNTPDEELHANITANSARDLPWLQFATAHDRVALMCGGGPSLAGHLDEIRTLQDAGGIVFAMNGASQFLRERGIQPDYQMIADAKPETAELVDPGLARHLIASQVNPETLGRACECSGQVTLWHPAIDEDIDRLFPEERRKRGGYALVGGGASVGNYGLCVAWVMGYRTYHLFGYDSSHRGKASHAYAQPMNQFIPNCEVEWAGQTYVCSIAMKAQAEKFQITGRALQREGCSITVHGDGLLPAMWNTPVEELRERDKYRILWSSDEYRAGSPGERLVPTILERLKPDGLVIDFGCGTGRASVELAKRGVPVFLIDFADNCRDEEAMGLPFLECDLTQPIPKSAPFGICCDVMEHIPEAYVPRVIENIMASAETVLFNISTIPEPFGSLIESTLHVTVHPHAWWRAQLERCGSIMHEDENEIASTFILHRSLQ